MRGAVGAEPGATPAWANQAAGEMAPGLVCHWPGEASEKDVPGPCPFLSTVVFRTLPLDHTDLKGGLYL